MYLIPSPEEMEALITCRQLNSVLKLPEETEVVGERERTFVGEFRIRLIYRALPTDVRRFEATNCDLCSLCGAGMDDICHICFECKAIALAAKMLPHGHLVK